MAEISVVAVGKLRNKHWRDAADDYLKRLNRSHAVEEVEVRAAHKNEQRDVKQAITKEGQALLGKIPSNARVVALDEGGRQMGSRELAKFVSSHMLYESRPLCFTIGGALGLDKKLLDRAERTLSLSKMTFPHEMARVILLEQLYRAVTIIRGEPYHKD